MDHQFEEPQEEQGWTDDTLEPALARGAEQVANGYDPTDYAMCAICDKSYDRRDLTQVLYHLQDPHRPVEELGIQGVMLKGPDTLTPREEIDRLRKVVIEQQREIARLRGVIDERS